MHERSAAATPTDPEALASSVTVAEDSRARLSRMFALHHSLVWRTLRRYGLDAQAAADVGQQAFVVAIERVDAIWEGSERAFLVGTALRLAASARRKAARVQLEAHMDQLAPEPHAESQARTVELLDAVLAQLDAGLVEVFVLFDIEGLTAPEISEALAIPVGTVASRLRRARESFRAVARRFELQWQREESSR
jgi:RNA polymerase sigma-70 factor (ECF subfamily)